MYYGFTNRIDSKKKKKHVFLCLKPIFRSIVCFEHVLIEFKTKEVMYSVRILVPGIPKNKKLIKQMSINVFHSVDDYNNFISIFHG